MWCDPSIPTSSLLTVKVDPRKIAKNLKILSLGQSDEYSFVLRRLSNIFNRRQCKISSLITSAFTSAFVFYWPQYFSTQNQSKLTFRKFEDYNSDVKSLLSESSTQLRYPPSFDGRCVLYPNERTLLDYLKWRQVDCHINNLYNTVFYALTGEYSRYTGKPDGGFNVYLPETKPFTSGRQYHSHQDATKILSGSSSGDKNEILFSSYGINYNNELEQFRKGTIFTLDIPANVSKEIETLSSEKQTKSTIRKLNEIQENFVNLDVTKQESFFRLLNVDIIGESFWETYGHLLQLWFNLYLHCFTFVPIVWMFDQMKTRQ